MLITFNGRRITLDDEAYGRLEDETYEILSPDSDDSVSLRHDYSGRGMYGTHCLGVVGNAGIEIAFAFALVQVIKDAELDVDMPEMLAFIALGTRSDDMGRSTIYYWPNVQLV